MYTGPSCAFFMPPAHNLERATCKSANDHLVLPPAYRAIPDDAKQQPTTSAELLHVYVTTYPFGGAGTETVAVCCFLDYSGHKITHHHWCDARISMFVPSDHRMYICFVLLSVSICTAGFRLRSSFCFFFVCASLLMLGV